MNTKMACILGTLLLGAFAAQADDGNAALPVRPDAARRDQQ